MSNREAYIKKAEAQLKEWSAQIDLLKAKGENLAVDAEIEFKKKLDEAEEKRSELSSYLEQLADKTDSIWDDIKDEAEEKWNTASKTFSDFIDDFKYR
ncbi:hypothetical protein [Nitrosomonas sp.]|uniref:hypothetical protein n=1 Tax=Nitrosomonas sp. TaxID=42353 RepID=UPI0033067778